MALVVEDGTGLSSAESYVTVADFASYHAARGKPDLDDDDEAAEAALRRATAYIDGRYRARWPGYRTHGRSQALAWPRRAVIDGEGNAVADDEVPSELIAATCEAAARELASPGALLPDSDGTRIVSETVGPISTTWADDGYRSLPEIPVIDRLVANLLTGSGSTKFAMRA